VRAARHRVSVAQYRGLIVRIAFWGVRGSTPTPARHTWRYGGNTPCLELRVADKLIILDAGTGIREFGNRLLSEAAGQPLDLTLFFSHYHWDHIQGLPFFAPIYSPANTLHLYGPHFADIPGSSLTAALQALFCAPFFPVVLEALQSRHPVQEFNPGDALELGPVRIRTTRLLHPQGSVAYRFEHDGSSFVYATDHEPGVSPDFDLGLRNLARGADLLIADAQYHPEQLTTTRKGWGHGSWESAARTAADAEVRNLVLFHHEPTHLDETLDELVLRARSIFPNTWGANENLIIELRRRQMTLSTRPARISQRADLNLPVTVETTEGGSTVREIAHLANLSFQGAYLLSPHPLQPQQPIDIVVPLPATSETVDTHGAEPANELRLHGTVLRSEPQTTNGHWVGAAIHFPDAAPPQKKKPEPEAPPPEPSPVSKS